MNGTHDHGHYIRRFSPRLRWVPNPAVNGLGKISGGPLAVAQRTPIPKWLALASGNMNQNLRFAPPVEF